MGFGKRLMARVRGGGSERFPGGRIAQPIPDRPWPPMEQPVQGRIVVSDRVVEALPVAGRCIDLLSSLVAGLPIHGERKVDSPPALLSGARSAEVEWPTYVTIEATVRALLTFGNAYWFIVDRYSRGAPMTVLQLWPPNVSRQRDDGGVPYYRVGNTKLDLDEVIHFRATGHAGFGSAANPCETLSRLWQLATAEQEMAKDYAVRGGRPIGFMTAPTMEVSAEELGRQAKAFDTYFRDRTSRVPVFGRGVEFMPISQSAADMQLIESRQWSATEICIAYGVPPHLVGVPAVESSTTYSSSLMDMASFARLTLSRWVRVLEAALRPQLGAVGFDLDSLLRAHTRERYEAYEIALRSGWMTVNEVRDSEGLDPLPGSDSVVSLQLVPDPVSSSEEGDKGEGEDRGKSRMGSDGSARAS